MVSEDVNNGVHQGKSSDSSAPAKRGLLASFVSSLKMNVVGTSALSREDVDPALVDMKRKLMERNVAEEIAAQVSYLRMHGHDQSGLTDLKLVPS